MAQPCSSALIKLKCKQPVEQLEIVLARLNRFSNNCANDSYSTHADLSFAKTHGLNTNIHDALLPQPPPVASASVQRPHRLRPGPHESYIPAHANVSLLDLSDDVLCAIALFVNTGVQRYRALRGLFKVCMRFKLGLPAILGEVTREAVTEADLFLAGAIGIDGNLHLLNLSGRGIGVHECQLISFGLARGALPWVQSIWLQNNRIGAEALWALAEGIKFMPDNTRLASLSLGHNEFTYHLFSGAMPPHIHRAISSLQDAAAKRRVCVRLNS
mmetsp:Transcript_41119/g.68350  ORF Transcript_41119/g.68350 Transcript_41119/m.68350 type:complete len:272 (-) Transcript_41119:250-1065(-)|eukprot:CAMPEP_0119313694 /NCGR_PEP_ID=MMETSP1333-20130426/30019_1 /TAXON_ID=418940 /ORGANISM="Scyphosphaera apsteinii, Strain RCC1455" /LENGTH=271 /DNA_ID=CAMNT_0007318593 /DNA_START=91 /DNA_END=906 /DNA_ORIENTATION=+